MFVRARIHPKTSTSIDVFRLGCAWVRKMAEEKQIPT